MIPLLDTNRLDDAEREIGAPCEQLLTPLTRYRAVRPADRFAIDNGAFTRFDEAAFLALLAREHDRQHLCRFVALPDVIATGRSGHPTGSAALTLQLFNLWRGRPELGGWPLAYVAQDGAENLPLPPGAAAVFVGGSTGWKDGAGAACVVRAAKMLGLWVHVGRINEPGRLAHFEGLGADSFDGSGLARYSHMREAIRARHSPAPLFAACPTLR